MSILEQSFLGEERRIEAGHKWSFDPLFLQQRTVHRLCFQRLYPLLLRGILIGRSTLWSEVLRSHSRQEKTRWCHPLWPSYRILIENHPLCYILQSFCKPNMHHKVWLLYRPTLTIQSLRLSLLSLLMLQRQVVQYFHFFLDFQQHPIRRSNLPPIMFGEVSQKCLKKRCGDLLIFSWLPLRKLWRIYDEASNAAKEGCYELLWVDKKPSTDILS